MDVKTRGGRQGFTRGESMNGFAVGSCSDEVGSWLSCSDADAVGSFASGHLSSVDCVTFHPNCNYIATGIATPHIPRLTPPPIPCRGYTLAKQHMVHGRDACTSCEATRLASVMGSVYLKGLVSAFNRGAARRLLRPDVQALGHHHGRVRALVQRTPCSSNVDGYFRLWQAACVGEWC